MLKPVAAALVSGSLLLNPNAAFAQTPAVSQFQDVFPDSWAYSALNQLVRNYDCLAGYPDGSFRGDRALSRYEFAAALNACLQQIERLLAATTANAVLAEDMATIDQLLREFNTELAIVRGRVDGMEARVQELEASQFSTTTKLSGDITFAFNDEFGGDAVNNITRSNASITKEAVMQYRARIELLTSFTGRDRLRTRLVGSNNAPVLADSGTTGGDNPANLLFSNDGRLAMDSSLVNRNSSRVHIDLLSYSFPLGERGELSIFGAGGSHYRYADTVNPYLDDEDTGSIAISRFGQRNPIYGIGGDGSGVGLNVRLSDAIQVDLGYLANQAGTPDRGFVNGNYSVLGQVVLGGDRAKLGLSMVHAYNAANEFRFGGSGTATGSFAANLIPLALNANAGRPFSDRTLNTPVVSNSYGIEAMVQPSDFFALSGWVGLTKARLIEAGDSDIWNYAIALSFPDLGKPGSMGMLLVGSEPTLRGLEVAGSRVPLFDTDNVWHIEAAYRYQLNDRIRIIPGLIWLPALNQNEGNDDVFILSIQSQFEF
ncbi:iron uptake porin [Spirulina major CS-329]|uniref:iron uptake porin n=1 Tax=Spirulina TaxID=1154 RepID=UPI00232FEFAC|nr:MULTISPECIES: iron uptake porin [Spirulina]MDB9495028.1 iron uptake porin [Spirulina subsalsa CS-330]MDB9504538.1 iron uptake porin [Spirulina major CS-329]